MKGVWGVVALIVFGFAAGYLMHEQEAKAGVIQPPPCRQFECVQMHAWWNPAFGVRAAFFAGGGGPIDDAWTNTFAKISSWNAPNGPNPAVPVVNIQVKDFNFCTPDCGKDAAGVWQARQVVTEVGPPGVVFPQRVQWICSPLRPGQPGGVGDEVLPPQNNNPNGDEPPQEDPGPGSGGGN